MSVYNGESYLREAIESVLAQTYGDLELVLIDDCSTDGSLEVARSFADGRVRIFSNEENLGLARSLNRGLSEVRGTFIARLDADDVCEPTRIERQVEYMDAHPELALVGCWYAEVNADGEVLGRYRLPCNDIWIRWAMLFYCPFVHSAVMMRRSMVPERTGGYDERYRYSMDFELWSRIVRSFRVANLDDYLVRLRVHARSMTQSGDYTWEGAELRRKNVARMLSWDASDSLTEQDARYVAMVRLQSGNHSGLDAATVDHAVEDLLELQRVFAEEENLPGPVRRSHRASIHARLARRLDALARKRRKDQDAVAAWRFSVASVWRKLLAVGNQRGLPRSEDEYCAYHEFPVTSAPQYRP